MAQQDEDGGVLPVVRTIGDSRGTKPDATMHGFGLGIAAVLLVVVLPLLPFVALVWLVTSAPRVLRGALTDDDPSTSPGRPGGY